MNSSIFFFCTVLIFWPSSVMSQINFEPGVTVTTFAGSGFRGYLDGKGQETMFYYITDIALAVDGTLFVNDRLNYRIRRVAPDLTVTTMLGDGTQITKNGWGTNFASSTIFSITVGPKGDLYFSDDVKIKKMTSDGCVSVVAGAGAGFQDGPALSAKFGGNMEVAFDSEGSLYITDPINHRIRLLSANGVVSSPIGSGDTILRDGRGIFSGVPNPRVLFVSKQGDLFFCDGNNGSVIRKVAADLTIVSLAGKDDSFGGHVDGPATSASFYGVSGIAQASDGSLILADSVNNSVRRLSVDLVVTTICGSGMIAGYKDGSGSQARFNRPAEVVVTKNGDILVADAENSCIRRVSFDTLPPFGTPALLQLRTYAGLTITGSAGHTYRIEGTPDLVNTNSWVTLETISSTESSQIWFDRNSPGSARRFYRAVLLR